MLMGLPGMTDDMADAILDWIDADDTPREQGAESDFYGSLDHGYAPAERPARFHRRALAGERGDPGVALRLRCGEDGL